VAEQAGRAAARLQQAVKAVQEHLEPLLAAQAVVRTYGSLAPASSSLCKRAHCPAAADEPAAKRALQLHSEGDSFLPSSSTGEGCDGLGSRQGSPHLPPEGLTGSVGPAELCPPEMAGMAKCRSHELLTAFMACVPGFLEEDCASPPSAAETQETILGRFRWSRHLEA